MVTAIYHPGSDFSALLVSVHEAQIAKNGDDPRQIQREKEWCGLIESSYVRQSAALHLLINWLTVGGRERPVVKQNQTYNQDYAGAI
jgi:hypothetical protein